MKIYLIITRTKLILSKFEYETSKDIQNDYQDYISSVGPMSIDEMIDYLSSEYPNTPPYLKEQLEDLATSSNFEIILEQQVEYPDSKNYLIEDKTNNMKTLPRWVTIPLGLILTPITFFCVIGSSILLLAPNITPTIFTILLGCLFLAGSLWGFYLSLRLLFVNPKSKTHFINPIGLRFISLIFVLIPIISLILGTFWEKTLIHSIMTLAYISIAIIFWNMAKRRAQRS